MDAIKKARELGKELQADERYTNYMAAKKASDEDEKLQEMINEFNLKRADLNNEISKQDKSEDRITELDREIRDMYEKIMTSDHMAAFVTAKEEMDELISNVNTIIMMCANGEDPDTCEIQHSCSGSCSTCGGCH